MILQDIAYCLVYAVIELILPIFTQKALHVLRTKKENPDQYANTYAISWTLQSLRPLPFPLSLIHTEMEYDNFAVRAPPSFTSVAITWVS